MTLSITYSELEYQILRRYNTTVNIKGINEKTICVSRQIVSFLSKARLNINIEHIEGTDVFLSYDGGLITKNIINGVIFFAQEELATQVSFTEKNHFTVHLGKIKDLENVFNALEIKDILFDVEKINLLLEFKDT